MKKLSAFLFLALLAGGSYTASAQDEKNDKLTTKSGLSIKPEAGDYAIGMDALPFLRYAGNFFNGNTSNTVGANFANNFSGAQVYGKYFLTDNQAIRARVRLQKNFDQRINRVTQDNQSQSNIEVEDSRRTSSSVIELGGGMEWRRGKGRLVGVYGAEAFIGYAANRQRMTYGNDFTAGNQTPTSTTNFDMGWSSSASSRIVEYTNPGSFSIGARGFAGVEYFVAPKISLGAEFYIGMGYTTSSRMETITEKWDVSSNAVVQVKDVDAGNVTSFDISTANYGGAINVMFHF